MEMIGYLSEHKECDCVAAYQRERHESKLLKTFKGWFYGLSNKIMQTKLYPGASDFRTMRRQMVNAVLQLSEYHRFSKGIFSWVGFNTYYMPYHVRERNAGSSKWSFKKLFEYAIEGIVAFTTKPLRIPVYLGAASLFASFVFLIYMIVKICLGTYITAHLAVYLLLLLGGSILVALGVIGEYLSKTYMETKGRPIYIIKNKWTTEGK